MLRLDGINTFYGTSHILHGISLEIADRELVAVLGRNGSGKTTLATQHHRRNAAACGLDPARRNGHHPPEGASTHTSRG